MLNLLKTEVSIKSCTNINCKETNPQPLANFAKCGNKLQYKCKICDNLYKRLNYDPDKVRKRGAIRYSKDREKILKLAKENYSKDNSKILERGKIWRNQAGSGYFKKWKEDNHDKCLIYNRNATAKRRAMKLKATPFWLSDKDQDQIYDLYKFCPDGYEVDHIIPLINKNVCGLHVPWNLQYLTVSENKKKKNNYTIEVYH